MRTVLESVGALGCLCGPDCHCNGARGVGQWGEGIEEAAGDVAGDVAESSVSSGAFSGIFSSLGDFFGSTFGSSLLKAGLTVGSGFAISELAGGHGGGGGGSGHSGGSVAPGGGTGQPIIIQQPPTQPAKSELPSWVMPAAVVGGLGLVALLLLRR